MVDAIPVGDVEGDLLVESEGLGLGQQGLAAQQLPDRGEVGVAGLDEDLLEGAAALRAPPW